MQGVTESWLHDKLMQRAYCVPGELVAGANFIGFSSSMKPLYKF